LLQALFNALEQRGHQVTATHEGKTILAVLGEALDVSLREPSKQVRHVPTAKELADAKQYSWMRPAPYDLVSSGTLVLNIENVWGIRHAWKDGKTKRLEDVLNDVVVGLIDAALQKKAQRKVADLCRTHGIIEQTYYRWKAKFGGMELSEMQRLKQLEDENRRLKRIVAEQTLDIQALKAVVAKKW
jgi:putative transposase